MKLEQRQSMQTAVGMYKDKVRIAEVTNATWVVEGKLFRKWVNMETEIYSNLYFSSNNNIPPRFYIPAGAAISLLVPEEVLEHGFQHCKVTGRVLPRYDPTSPDNINLFEAMHVTSAHLSVTASNPSTTADLIDEKNLQEYVLQNPLNLTENQGLGLYVTGDGSNGTLVIRVKAGAARDFAVPLNFIGRQWIEIPTPGINRLQNDKMIILDT